MVTILFFFILYYRSSYEREKVDVARMVHIQSMYYRYTQTRFNKLNSYMEMTESPPLRSFVIYDVII